MSNNRQRLYFLVKEEKTCDAIEKSLIEFGVDDDRVFIYDSLSEDLVALPDQHKWERNRRIPIVVWGVVLGGLAGFAASSFRSLSDPNIPVNMTVIVTIVAAIIGGLMFRAAAGDEHQKRLEYFQDSLYQKGLLLVTDVKRKDYRRVHQQIVARHPSQYLGSIDLAKH